MKIILLLVAGLLIRTAANAQTETVSWNGKTYYVYPHQQEMGQSQYLFLQYAEYREVLLRDENNQKVVSSEIREIEPEERYAYYRTAKPTKAQKQQEKFMRELMAKKPDLFYNYGNNTERDITPSLTAIPDGDYVQYYRDLPYLDNNIIRFRNDVVAGVFSIKNNVLDGPATWYSANGMVIRQGSFSGGSRTGSWVFRTFTPKNPQELSGKSEDYDLVLKFLLDPALQYDTTAEHQDYLNGLRHGDYRSVRNNDVIMTGHYTANEESGTWETFSYKFRIENELAIYTDSLTLIRRFTFAKDKNLRGKSVIIRSEAVDPEFLYYGDYDYYGEEESLMKDSLPVLYNQYDYEGVLPNYSDYYTVLDRKLPNDEGLELPEEAVYTYEGEEYSEEVMYDDMRYGGEGEYGSYDSEYVNGKYYTRNELIDSLGYHFDYEGVYEEYYSNGQLKFRFEVENGVLKSEEPVYWENGNVANEVSFDQEKKEYTERFYDYNGKLYSTKVYDEKGNLLEDESASEAVIIDGLEYYMDYEMLPTMYYSSQEKLEKEPLTERTLIQAGRWTKDSTLFMSSYLDPASQTLDHTEYNVMGDVYETQKVTFGDDYENANGLINKQVGFLRLETTANGSLFDFSMYPFMAPRNDSAQPQSNALYWQNNYELQSDDILYQGDKPFSGTFSLKSRSSAYKMSASEKSINVEVPDNGRMQKQITKALRKFYKKGKRNKILDFYTGDFYYGSSAGLMYDLFPHISFLFNFDEYDSRYFENNYGDDYMYEGENKPKKKKQIEYPHDKTITGQYLDGRPEGEWIVKDQFGNITARLTFKKGDRSGEALYYATEYPMSDEEKYDRDEYIEKYHTYIFDAAPEKKTHYLSQREFYVNGMMEGPSVTFNWKGDTLSYDEYHEGRQHGLSYQRNKIFYSVAAYEDGAIDGISQTYLTIPGQDSILIFDLNFQNGALQGESRSYHTNGKLAKRGFFLTGDPIDDYEAFDTLGFKYQYVKFQFNQPVEEKIWEENQLSVRYQFDWKDSIPFFVQDIAASSSFERLAVDLGLIRNPYTEPYYGRPSLLDKTGVDYELTKYYPNDTVARIGKISKGKKVGYWKHFSYEGKPLYEVTYFDTLLTINDSVKFKSKGVLTYLDSNNRALSKSYIIEKVEKYDCSHTDHTEERMLYGFWQADEKQGRINGYAKNYYDNGAIQNEGNVENGLPTGTWKLYDSDGQLNQVGNYVQGKRHGRWLSGDLSNFKNMGEICLNPNLENLEEIMAYQEKLLDVSVVYYHMGKIVKREYYGINRNNTEAPEEFGEEMYYRE